MSHISLLEAERNRNQDFATPHPKERGRRVKDFACKSGKFTSNFTPCRTPSARRIFAATDLVAAMDEEDNDQAVQGQNIASK